MRSIGLAVIVTVVAWAWPAIAGATNHYACDCAAGADASCVAGNDGAAGTSPGAAWRTYDRAQDAWATLAAGDMLLLCRGGVFPVAGATRWVNGNCTAANRCTVGAYDAPSSPANLPRPRLETVNAGVFALDDGGPADHEEGYVLRDLDIACSACDAGTTGVFFFNDIDDVRMERLRVSGFGDGIVLGGALACGADPRCDGRNLRIALVDSEIRDSVRQGWFGISDDLLLQGNRFIDNGVADLLNHNVYLGGNATRARVIGNELYGSARRGTGICVGAPLVVHGLIEDLLIEDNLIREDVGGAGGGCWGINIAQGGYSYAETFLRVVIRGNTIRDTGNAAIAISNCVDCTVENNVITHAQPFGVRAIYAAALAGDPDDARVDRLVVRNNAIHTTTPGSVGIRVSGEGASHVVVSNAIAIDAPTGDFSCLQLELPTAAYTAVDHNVCGFAPGANRRWNTGHATRAAWQAASGFDAASIEADPGFAAPLAPAWSLRAATSTAMMVDRGDPTRSTARDRDGRDRLPPPDAGAYEWLGGEPFADGFE